MPVIRDVHLSDENYARLSAASKAAEEGGTGTATEVIDAIISLGLDCVEHHIAESASVEKIEAAEAGASLSAESVARMRHGGATV